MHDFRSVGILAIEQKWRHEIAAPILRSGQTGRLGIAHDPRRFRLQGLEAFANVFQLRGIDQRSHPHRRIGRVAHDQLAKLVYQRFDTGFPALGRYQHAPDRGAFLARFLAYIGGDVADHLLPGLAAGRDVRTEYRGVQAVRLDVDSHGRPNMRLKAPQAFRGLARAREGKHVLRSQVMQQVAR